MTVTHSVGGAEATVHTHLDACPAIELAVTVEPLPPVRDPDMSNNSWEGRIFVCPH